MGVLGVSGLERALVATKGGIPPPWKSPQRGAGPKSPSVVFPCLPSKKSLEAIPRCNLMQLQGIRGKAMGGARSLRRAAKALNANAI